MNLLIVQQAQRRRAEPPVSSRDCSGCSCRASGRKRYPSVPGRIFSRFWSSFQARRQCAFLYPFMWMAFPPM